MVRESRGGDDRTKHVLVVAALVLPLALVVSTYAHARRTESSRQATVDGALKDYAAIAAWQLSSHLNDAFHQAVMARLGRGGRPMPMMSMSMSAGGSGGAAPPLGRGPPGFADLGTLLTSRVHECPACPPSLGTARSAFRLHPESGSVEWSGARPDADYERSVVALVHVEMARASEEPHRVVFATLGGHARALALSIDGAPPRTTVGIDVDSSAFADAVTQVLRRASLLPTALVAPPFTPRELSVRLTLRDSAVIFENAPGSVLRLAMSDTMASLWGGLRVTVEVRPALAAALLLDRGEPASARALLALTLLALILAGAALLQLRRGWALARARTRFVASVSHELRTPLAHISLFAETLMLARERSAEERQRFASVIHREARRLAMQVEGILRFSQREAVSPKLRIEARRIAGDLAEALGAFTPLAQAAGATLTLSADLNLRALVDPGALRQVLFNLLDNATKYGPVGQEILIKASLMQDQVLVTVEDAGPGIPVADRERVFEPFVRLDTPGHVSGTGIGMAVVRDLVTAHGGRVWIEDGERGGARVCVNFAAAAPAAADEVRVTINAGEPAWRPVS